VYKIILKIKEAKIKFGDNTPFPYPRRLNTHQRRCRKLKPRKKKKN